MSESIDKALKSLEMKIQRLMEHVRFLRNRNEELKKELVEKEETINRLRQMLLEEKDKFNSLMIAGLIAKGENVKLATQRINDLMREVDECIALLTEE